MNVGKRIKELRTQAGYTQNKLAEWAGVSQTHLRRVELGEADITVNHLRLICDALGVSLKEFFNDGENQEELSSAAASLSPKQKQQLVSFLKSLR